MSGMISVTCSRIQVPRKPFLDSYYKSRQALITNHDSFFYYKSRQGRITNHVSFFITNHDKFITNHDRYYKLRQVYYKSRQVLQITTVITNHDRTFLPRAQCATVQVLWCFLGSRLDADKNIGRFYSDSNILVVIFSQS